MSETVFGYHAVESVIRHEPGRIQALHAQADRQDKRMQSLLVLARNQGVTVPDGWIIDAQGRPSNDPEVFYDTPEGAILPFGGHKGYGLGLMVEILAGGLSGGG